jgi:hypothetical protein
VDENGIAYWVNRGTNLLFGVDFSHLGDLGRNQSLMYLFWGLVIVLTWWLHWGLVALIALVAILAIAELGRAFTSQQINLILLPLYAAAIALPVCAFVYGLQGMVVAYAISV